MAIFDKKEKTESAVPQKLPQHIGFIMDGNGRWAKKRGLPRHFGHWEGEKNFRKIARYCRKLGVKTVSFYAFSTENWNRPKIEVDTLLEMFDKYLDDIQEILDEDARMIFVGDRSAFPENIQKKMLKVETETSVNYEFTIIVAVNYGGRAEITRSARILAQKVADGEMKPDEITEQSISENLYTADFPDVDFLIRTSGELRISNYFIWQCAYAEYYFTDVLWPDFSPDDLDKALAEFDRRHRRFGGV